MEIKNIIFDDFINYKLPSMTIEFPHCTFKCNKECGKEVCQNVGMLLEPNVSMKTEDLIELYIRDDLSQAIVCQGLEPFDSWEDLKNLIFLLRTAYNCEDYIIIYTGYNEDELQEQLNYLKLYNNIIVKFGRFIPDQKPHYDEILGVELASNNQYAKKIC